MISMYLLLYVLEISRRRAAQNAKEHSVSFDSSIDDTPSENPSTDAYDGMNEPEKLSINARDGTDTGNDVDLMTFEGAQDRRYDSEEYEIEKMMTINNEDCW